MKTFLEIATEVGELVTEKNAAYGSSFAKCGEYLWLLFPNGLRPEQFGEALLLARDFDKSMRIATARDAFGESPWADKAGYAILGAQMHQQKEGRGGCPENASGVSATFESKGQPDSALPSTAPQTLPSDGASIGSEESPRQSNCCARPTSVPAANATEVVSASEGDREPIKLGGIDLEILLFLKKLFPKGGYFRELHRARRAEILARQGFLASLSIGWQITDAGLAYLESEAAMRRADDQARIRFLIGRLRLLMSTCNGIGLCARCGGVIKNGSLRFSIWGEEFIVCGSCSVPDADDWKLQLVGVSQ